MAYDEHLADRINIQLEQKKVSFKEKKMFGGLCYMVDDKMCVGVMKDNLMLRIDPEDREALKEADGVEDMDFTGRTMKGFLYARPSAIDSEEALSFYLDKALEFNPKANASKKKKI